MIFIATTDIPFVITITTITAFVLGVDGFILCIHDIDRGRFWLGLFELYSRLLLGVGIGAVGIAFWIGGIR